MQEETMNNIAYGFLLIVVLCIGTLLGLHIKSQLPEPIKVDNRIHVPASDSMMLYFYNGKVDDAIVYTKNNRL